MTDLRVSFKTTTILLLSLFLLTECNNREKYLLENPQGHFSGTFEISGTKSHDAPISFNELPKQIQDSSSWHLINLVGQKYYSRLKYSGGQILEYHDTLEKVYYLYFSFRDDKLKIKNYSASVALNQEGQLIELIDLPDINKNPFKATIINIRQAYESALKNTIDNGKLINAEINFDKNTLCIVWIFTFETEKGKQNGYKHIISVNAHNGDIIDQHKMLEYKQGMIESAEDFEKIIDSTKYK